MIIQEFMQKEARIACNPIASPLMLNLKTADDRLSKRAKTFNTSIQIKGFHSTLPERSKPPCLFCRNEVHGVTKCPVFVTKTMEEKRDFIHEHHLCFGCLRKGHSAKDCKRRHTCNTCGRRHPTCLHRENSIRPAEIMGNVDIGDHVNNEVHKAMSHALTQHASATSSIIPVLVSSTADPQREILTYALLDTQSDSTFMLEDLAMELNVNTQPVQLKLSTMTAVNTVTASKTVSGLHVQQAYTRDFIPVDKSHIPTNKYSS